MLVTVLDGAAWLRTEPETGTLGLGGMIDHRAGLELIPAIVVALNDEVTWRVLSLEEVTALSMSGDRLVRSVCRLAAKHGASLQVVYPGRTPKVDDPEVVPAECRRV